MQKIAVEMMYPGQRILVLRAFRPFLRFITGFNFENFQRRRNTLRDVGRNIVVALGVVIVTAASLRSLWWNFWHYKTMNISSVNSNEIVLVLALSQQLLIFFSMVLKNRQFTIGIEYLQKTVDGREYLLSIC